MSEETCWKRAGPDSSLDASASTVVAACCLAACFSSGTDNCPASDRRMVSRHWTAGTILWLCPPMDSRHLTNCMMTTGRLAMTASGKLSSFASRASRAGDLPTASALVAPDATKRR